MESGKSENRFYKSQDYMTILRIISESHSSVSIVRIIFLALLIKIENIYVLGFMHNHTIFSGLMQNINKILLFK